jgi:hypothetical protein
VGKYHIADVEYKSEIVKLFLGAIHFVGLNYIRTGAYVAMDDFFV